MLHALDLTDSVQTAETPWQAISKNDNETIECVPRGSAKAAVHFDIGSKLVSAERAVSAIRAGSRIYIGTGCAAPHSLLVALEAMNPGPADLEFVSFVTTSALPQVGGASKTHYRHRAFLLAAKCEVWLAAASLNTCPFRSRRYRFY
jgi:hypothetical protein